MPFNHNAARRDKFPKAKYKVTNSTEYNESLRQRGDMTVWVSEEAVARWLRRDPASVAVSGDIPTSR